MPARTRHDRFFRQMMRFKSFQRAFIECHVPSKVTAPASLNKLEPVPEAFARANKAIIPDCVLRAPFKKRRRVGLFPDRAADQPKR